MESTNFTVDAALLSELGDRLIGRSYIALAELVKNSYDADAADCKIEFAADRIAVIDNGHGMSEREFHDHWMRIGTTHKTDERTSRRLARPMTGSKGLGRLSVQFLADEMTLESTSVNEPSRCLYAIVDWKDISPGKDIGTVHVLWEMRSCSQVYPGGRSARHENRSALPALGVGRPGDWRSGGDRYGCSNRRSDGPAGGPTPGTAQDFYVDIDAPDIDRARKEFGRLQNALFDNWKARIRGGAHRRTNLGPHGAGCR